MKYIIVLENGMAMETDWDTSQYPNMGIIAYCESHKFLPVNATTSVSVSSIGIIQEKEEGASSKKIIVAQQNPNIDLSKIKGN